jgi:enoyl-CoA hydratase/carnithine racemase
VTRKENAVTYQTLIYNEAKDIVRITINRPAQLNSMNVLVARELSISARRCSADPAVRCVVLTGAGDRAFCSGGDVGGFASDPTRVDILIQEMTEYLEEAISVFARMRAPIIAEVNGAVAGAGLGLVAAADFAIASEKARFTSAYTKIGLTPDGGTTWFLPRLIGHRRTKGTVPSEPVVVRGRGNGSGISQSRGGSRRPASYRCSSCRTARQRSNGRLRVRQAASALERWRKARAADEA